MKPLDYFKSQISSQKSKFDPLPSLNYQNVKHLIVFYGEVEFGGWVRHCVIGRTHQCQTPLSLEVILKQMKINPTLFSNVEMVIHIYRFICLYDRKVFSKLEERMSKLFRPSLSKKKEKSKRKKPTKVTQ